MFFKAGDEEGKRKVLEIAPQAVETSARQMIKFCWIQLPPSRRNLTGLKEELNVVIEREFPQMMEELKRYEQLLE